MSINRWIDKEDVVYLYNGILLSHMSIQPLCASQEGGRTGQPWVLRGWLLLIGYFWGRGLQLVEGSRVPVSTVSGGSPCLPLSHKPFCLQIPVA